MATEILKNMTKEDLQAHFADNREITYKGVTVGVMEWDNGTYDILSPANNENGYITINDSPFIAPREALDFMVDYLLELDDAEEEDDVEEDEADTSSTKKTKKKKSAKKAKEEKYNGPRTVKVFGREIYIENDINLTNEQIRSKIETEYNFPNFKSDKVFYDFDASTGTLEILLKFNTKG